MLWPAHSPRHLCVVCCVGAAKNRISLPIIFTAFAFFFLARPCTLAIIMLSSDDDFFGTAVSSAAKPATIPTDLADLF